MNSSRFMILILKNDKLGIIIMELSLESFVLI